MTDALTRTLARINRLRAARSGRVVDLERVRLQRELKALPGLLGPEGWRRFLDELVAALVHRIPRTVVCSGDERGSSNEGDEAEGADADEGDQHEGGGHSGG